MEAKDWDGLVEWLLAKVEALRGAGAEFAAIGANTPHVVFERVQARSPLPLRSIVEATRAEGGAARRAAARAPRDALHNASRISSPAIVPRRAAWRSSSLRPGSSSSSTIGS